MVAVRMKSIECTRLLLEHGALVNCRSTHTGNTALLIAAKNGAADCLLALLQKGANLDVEDANGETALDLFMKMKPSYEVHTHPSNEMASFPSKVTRSLSIPRRR